MAYFRNGLKTKTRTCDLCYQQFASKSSLKYHKKKHKDPRVFHCEKCYHFFKKSHFSRHMKKHGHNDQFIVDNCVKDDAKKFDTPKDNAEGGAVAAAALEKGELSCTLCGKQYGSVAALDYHLNRHKDTSSFYCDKCRHFYKKSKYKEHMKKHEVLVCEVCKEAFGSLYYLQKHRFTSSH